MVNVVAAVVDAAKMKLNKQFERHLEKGRFFNKKDKVVVAVSTGVDSMVLLDLLECLPESSRPEIIVAHVNHHLRPQSSVEEDFIRQYCREHQLELSVHQWLPEEHPQAGTEEAARKMRYRFFAEVMKRSHASVLMTAHHQNDLAETMLMKLTRGGQLQQLIGIEEQRPFANGRLERPLLIFSKEELRSYATKRGLKWYEDETNQELTVSRNRFRHRILPLLVEENPQFLQAFTNYHQQLELAVELENEFATAQLQKLEDKNGRLQLEAFLMLSTPKQRLLVTKWLEEKNICDLKAGFVEQLLADISNRSLPQFKRQLTPELTLIKNYSELYVEKVNRLPQKTRNSINSVVKLGHWYSDENSYQLAVAKDEAFFKPGEDYQEMWLAPQQFPLTLRHWHEADRLPLKNGGHQKVGRVLIDQKVPLSERHQQLVLVDANDVVVWVVNRKWGWFDRPDNYQKHWQRLFIGVRDLKRRRV